MGYFPRLFIMLVAANVCFAATNKVSVAFEKPIEMPSDFKEDKMSLIKPIVYDIEYMQQFEDGAKPISIEKAVSFKGDYIPEENFEYKVEVNPETVMPIAFIGTTDFKVQSYPLAAHIVKEKPLHWIYPMLNPRYCSTIYGIALEMQFYERHGLPIPKEVIDRMNKAIDLYFWAERLRENKNNESRHRRRR